MGERFLKVSQDEVTHSQSLRCNTEPWQAPLQGNVQQGGGCVAQDSCTTAVRKVVEGLCLRLAASTLRHSSITSASSPEA